MARIIGSAPILLVAEVAAAEYYRDRLGFTYPGSGASRPASACRCATATWSC